MKEEFVKIEDKMKLLDIAIEICAKNNNSSISNIESTFSKLLKLVQADFNYETEVFKEFLKSVEV